MADKTNPLNSESIQNFIKSVYTLEQRQEGRVSTNALAEMLTITAPSVTDMARRLQEMGLLDYQKYRGVILTAEGEALALKVLRRHRLIELYLVEELGYALQDVHDEAEHLEHAVSDQFIEAISRRLGHPDIDPHGDPIPAVDGTITPRDLQTLIHLPPRTPAVVSRIESDNQEMLHHILERGFKLGARIEMLTLDPFEGPVTVRVDGEKIVIGHHVASAILVEVLS